MERRSLIQLNGVPLLSDGGLETTLVFHQGIELPGFAAFDLLRRERGAQLLTDYFRSYLALGREAGTGFVMETPTWRANPAWGPELGYSSEELEAANRQAVALLMELREEEERTARSDDRPDPVIQISGCIGPRGDGYVPDQKLSAEEAEVFHSWQIGVLSRSGVDLVTAFTLSAVPEAVGIVRAARAEAVPVVISFTVETDGRLPSGQPLSEAIERVDAETDGAAAYFMVNCAHPSHVAAVLEQGGPWRERIVGLRANASRRSHAELDAAESLDEGDPDDLARLYRELSPLLPNLAVLGGCCGTDLRHVQAIARATLPLLWEGLNPSLDTRISR
ncbi:homocysteine S-methyltransferase family protein [Cyanobium sp. PCC 7001]|uniref:homocysteine S-methyltransferase family protein n=1 Tax=Cyanobium sp. PCC 7001 TaxID=180281 RepID=UPI00030A6958|nr:homocysteine S-methyltransferase family protein [Cyanobium sp. PCC 7001]